MEDPKLLLGMAFSSVNVFKEALKEHAIKTGYVFNYIKNESSRAPEDVKKWDGPSYPIDK
ncbi:hypothetical protein HAX54_002108, partial [Datura stramonium]|nr:hypothetical protein [Datura stramonium]